MNLYLKNLLILRIYLISYLSKKINKNKNHFLMVNMALCVLS